YAFGVYMSNSVSSGSSGTRVADYKYREIKIEYGNKATDWSPAPDDVDAQIVDLNTQLTAVHSTIEQLPDQINLAVSEGIADLEIGGRNLWLGEAKPHIN